MPGAIPESSVIHGAQGMRAGSVGVAIDQGYAAVVCTWLDHEGHACEHKGLEPAGTQHVPRRAHEGRAAGWARKRVGVEGAINTTTVA